MKLLWLVVKEQLRNVFLQPLIWVLLPILVGWIAVAVVVLPCEVMLGGISRRLAWIILLTVVVGFPLLFSVLKIFFLFRWIWKCARRWNVPDEIAFHGLITLWLGDKPCCDTWTRREFVRRYEEERRGKIKELRCSLPQLA